MGSSFNISYCNLSDCMALRSALDFTKHPKSLQLRARVSVPLSVQLSVHTLECFKRAPVLRTSVMKAFVMLPSLPSASTVGSAQHGWISAHHFPSVCHLDPFLGSLRSVLRPFPLNLNDVPIAVIRLHR